MGNTHMQVLRFIPPQNLLWKERYKRQGGNLRQERNSLVAQWLRLHASTAEGAGSILVQGSSACHMVWPKKKERERKGTS